MSRCSRMHSNSSGVRKTCVSAGILAAERCWYRIARAVGPREVWAGLSGTLGLFLLFEDEALVLLFRPGMLVIFGLGLGLSS